MGLQDCIPKGFGGCPPNDLAFGVDSRRAKTLEKRLREILKEQSAKTTSSRISEFAIQLAKCETRSKRQTKFLKLAYRLPKSDILFWISEAYQKMEVDEALWRSFLAAHFGRVSLDPSEKAQSAGEFLCAFGACPYWTWVRVSSDTDSFRSSLIKNGERLKALSFGNHRKYEAKKPLIFYRVITSFLDWVKDNGGTPESAFQRNSRGGPEANFDTLYYSLKSVFRFGRTCAFDLLCMLGNMGILPVRAGSCYLPGSTGPLSGARKLWGRRRPKELGRLSDLTAQALGIPFEVFEDALCMWQK
jgi:hypothetical protein